MANGRTLLLDENPLVIQPSLAAAIGLNKAVIMQQVHYWLQSSRHSIGGRKWVYNSMKEWGKQFPFWSNKTIERAFNELIAEGLLLVANHNRKKSDNTRWYSINYDVLSERVEEYLGLAEPQEAVAAGEDTEDFSLGQNVGMEEANLHLPYRQNDEVTPPNCLSDFVILGGPLPETTTETNSDIVSQSVSQSGVGRTDGKAAAGSDRHTRELEDIIRQCELPILCKGDPELVQSITMAIQSLYHDRTFAEKNLQLPLPLIRRNLKCLNLYMIDYALRSMRQAAAGGTVIKSPARYLQRCIYNAIADCPSELLADEDLALMALYPPRSFTHDNAGNPGDTLPKWTYSDDGEGGTWRDPA